MPAAPPLRSLTRLLPGLGFALAAGALATLVGLRVPVLGGPVVGVLLGLLTRHSVGERASLKPGVAFSSKRVLQTAIVLLGTGLSLGQVAHVGWTTLPVMLGTLAVALLSGWWLTRWLGLDRDLGTLITVGTSICGASAIATLSAVIGAADAAIVLSVTVIFAYNVAAAVLFPMLGHALGLSQEAFGLWAGTAVNDTSSVVAAATAYGAAAASFAVVVKLTRTLMIIPISVGAALHRGQRDGGGVPWTRLVPGFLVWFLVAAAANSLGLVPAGWHGGLKLAAVVLTSAAMAAIGYTADRHAIARAGWRPLALGGALWVLVALSSLLLQRLAGLA